MRTTQMKLFSLLVVVMALTAVRADEKDIGKVFNDCTEKMGVKTEDFDRFPETLLTSEPLKCTIKCGLDEFNLLSEAGVLNAEKSFEIVDSNTKMEELARVKMRETIAECSKKYSTPVEGNELCQRAVDVVTCIIKRLNQTTES